LGAVIGAPMGCIEFELGGVPGWVADNASLAPVQRRDQLKDPLLSGLSDCVKEEVSRLFIDRQWCREELGILTTSIGREIFERIGIAET
jgi:hypothetical protein